MNIKPIRTKDDYKAAMTRISELTSGDSDALHAIEFDELEVLTMLSEAYENVHYKIDAQVQQKQLNLEWKSLD